MQTSAAEQAGAFLRVADYFNLGHILTEQAHPKTRHLSEAAQQQLDAAIVLLKNIDVEAFDAFSQQLAKIYPLSRAVQHTLKEGGRIFLCGCGATGRLALFLEFLWRQIHADDRVVAFMAGGDIALVHALEGFEDFSEYGDRHLAQLGFDHNDLLIACSEGGETPFVIGAVEKAAAISRRQPYFLYCNPDHVLTSIPRSKKLIENPAVNTVSLPVGPMSLAGSTRMQASSVLQLAIGLALFFRSQSIPDAVATFMEHYRQTPLQNIKPLIVNEADIYRQHDKIIYVVKDYGITAFTDTTERAPTFSLVAFDNLSRKLANHSLCYVALANAFESSHAWHILLGRAPRSLEWLTNDKTRQAYLLSYDFSESGMRKRQAMLPHCGHHLFHIEKTTHNTVRLALDGHEVEFSVHGLHPLFEHTLLKSLLNNHSTLVMGRLQRYTYNLMTYVNPSNGKLIDRATRYVQWLLQYQNHERVSYRAVVHELFLQKTMLREGEAIVIKAYEAIKRRHGLP